MAEIYGRGKGYEIKGKMKKSLGIKEKEDNWNIWKRKNVNIKIYNQHILKTNLRVGISNRNQIIFQRKRKAENKTKNNICKYTQTQNYLHTKGCSLRLELKFRNCHRAKY